VSPSKWKDYRAKGKTKHKTMTLSTGEFMRRFLLHVLPRGFHRIRHYGLIANAGRRENLARARELLNVPTTADDKVSTSEAAAEPVQPTYVCPDCGAPMTIVETLVRGQPIRAAFTLCHGDVHFCVRCRHRIWRNRAAIDSFNGGTI
jgi:hypothetical protein